MKRIAIVLVVTTAGLAITYASGLIPKTAIDSVSNSLHQSVNPGVLSAAHANLTDNCQACHTPLTGVDTVK
ncbi:MAG: hypothetical protein ABJG45_20700, partial [Rhodopirellula bahusiensis]